MLKRQIAGVQTAEQFAAGPRKNLQKPGNMRYCRAPNFHGRSAEPPEQCQPREGAQSVEVGDFPFLESIFMIFGKSSAISAENETLRTISSRNDQKPVPSSRSYAR